MKYYILHITGLLIILFASVHAGDAALTYAYRFADIGNYRQAIIEYKRFMFFNPNYEYAGEIYYKMGMAYKNLGEISDAVETLKKSVEYVTNDSIKTERTLDIAVLYLAKRAYTDAEFELLRIAHFGANERHKQRAYFLLGILYLYNYKWDKCREMFQKTFSVESGYQELDSLFAVSHNLNYKHPKLAKWLSTFIPGSGQIYCGDWRNGINAFALTSLLGYALVESVLELRYIDILFTTSPYFERYYFGNRDNAVMIAQDYNKTKNKKMAIDIIKKIQEEEVKKASTAD
jgi:tetratricopeptide (TPR) repeat protein